VKLSRSVIIILLAALLLLFTLLPAAGAGAVPAAHAQGPIAPTPPPAVATPNPIDQANAEADRWRTVADQAVSGARAAIGQAYSAIASAEAGLAQAQMAAEQEHAARVAAEQGQINQAVQSAQAALVASNQAYALATSANGASIDSMQQAMTALRNVRTLTDNLSQAQGTIAGLTGANKTQQARITQLEQYSWSTYRETITAWVVAGVLGFVLLAGICALVIIMAMERRNRWPRFKHGLGGALVVPVPEGQRPDRGVT
jgi:hypothetical protein